MKQEQDNLTKRFEQAKKDIAIIKTLIEKLAQNKQKEVSYEDDRE